LISLDLLRLSEHNSLVLVLEPLNGIILGKLVGESNLLLASLPPGNAGSGTGEADKEVHAINSSGRVVLDSEIDVLVDSESEVSGRGEVLLEELELLDLEATLEDLGGLVTANGYMAGDLLVTPDSEGPDSVAGLGEDRLLSGKLLEHTGSPGKAITGLSNAAVQDELVNLDVLHHVGLGVSHICYLKRLKGGRGGRGEREAKVSEIRYWGELGRSVGRSGRLGVYRLGLMVVIEGNVGGGQILGSLVGSRSRGVVGMFWRNVVGRDVFVDTCGGGKGCLVGGREKGLWNGRFNVITHYLLLEFLRKKVPCETKEMTEGGGGVGMVGSGGREWFWWDMATLRSNLIGRSPLNRFSIIPYPKEV